MSSGSTFHHAFARRCPGLELCVDGNGVRAGLYGSGVDYSGFVIKISEVHW
jgi:hypothetical protein